jgi:hypothetical protein
MWDFSLSRAFGLMMQTSPYVLFRIVVYVGIALAYVIVTGVGAGTGYGIGGFWGPDARASGSIWGGLLGFGLTAGVLYLLREYILYIVKAGHIAVLVALLDQDGLPEGKGQVNYGAQIVRERFGQASALFGLDQLIKGVIRAITGVVEGVAMILPIPGLDNLARLFRAFLKVAVGFVDEVILAYAIRTQSQNPWESAETALVLYGQNYRAMLKNAAWLAIIIYGLSFLIFLFLLAPAIALVYFMPGAWGASGVVFALIFAWAFKAALLEPFAVACMMQVFFSVAEGQTPDPEWKSRLSGLTNKFQKLQEKAGKHMGRATARPE